MPQCGNPTCSDRLSGVLPLSEMMERTSPDLRAFLAELLARGELRVVEAVVDPVLEAAEIHRRVIAAGGPALLFAAVRGAGFPLVTNLFGTPERARLAFGTRPRRLIEEAVRAAESLLPPTAAGCVVAQASSLQFGGRAEDDRRASRPVRARKRAGARKRKRKRKGERSENAESTSCGRAIFGDFGGGVPPGESFETRNRQRWLPR
jgi:hypothetical protein